MSHDAVATIEHTPQGLQLVLQGDWVIDSVGRLSKTVQELLSDVSVLQMVDASRITRMDTAGAFTLSTLFQQLSEQFSHLTLIGLCDNFQELYRTVSSELVVVRAESVSPLQVNFLARIGEKSVEKSKQTRDFIAFIGETFIQFATKTLRPLSLQWRSIMHEIEVGGYQALPIIAVMMMLIGVVIVYQLGVELQTYGANIYLPELTGIAVLREFSPLISSVIIAGRTSTSFAALIGTMKVNEELDALRTMGLSPIERLVLPKIIGLLVALPLLVVWGSIFGIFGGMIMAKSMMGMSYTIFLERLKQEVALKHLYLGMVKTPIFALIIAGIGCFQGFQAKGSAQSVGERTTKAAVQAIFLIIFADGMFSILFNWMNL